MGLVPLQAELCNREMDNAVSIDRKAIPLDQDVKQRQREAEARVERRHSCMLAGSPVLA